jgi:hypothetical protein
MAMMGPMIGAAPAIDLNWYPNRTFLLVGMNSTPSIYILAGVALLISAFIIFVSTYLE